LGVGEAAVDEPVGRRAQPRGVVVEERGGGGAGPAVGQQYRGQLRIPEQETPANGARA
jgi:hypothetical protein